MEQKIRLKTEQLMHQSLMLIRGPVMERAIQIESHMDVFIASTFTDDLYKEDEIICLILAHTAMKRKLRIFAYLINKYKPSFKEESPNFYNDLCSINAQRNKLAHFPASFTLDAVQNYISSNKLTLAKVRFEKTNFDTDDEMFEFKYMSEDDINNLIKDMDAYISKLRILTGHDPNPSNSQEKS